VSTADRLGGKNLGIVQGNRLGSGGEKGKAILRGQREGPPATIPSKIRAKRKTCRQPRIRGRNAKLNSKD